ncbi:hypothetical protein DPX16_17620 [Anabarilius grahami]|uniref:Uncharacterized protein n=1 Tax=Anabarilius grahami TaxID=495550 RepID=A0A3N0XZK2_ANAGA|nr:hypothetical protein DPX16_17620 [Anabarilius grahami]
MNNINQDDDISDDDRFDGPFIMKRREEKRREEKRREEKRREEKRREEKRQKESKRNNSLCGAPVGKEAFELIVWLMTD